MTSKVPKSVLAVEDGFWNIRGSFKTGGLVDVGTQASLVRLASGGFVFLDAYSLSDEVRRWVDEQTDGGRAIEAVLNLHPFHTLHVRKVHEMYPAAKLYGTARHLKKFDDLPWEPLVTEETACHERFAEDFDFSVPRGVALIPDNENLHFSSVLAFHRATRTLHVDDTLCYARLPKPLHLFASDMLRFHPTLSQVLEERAGAVAEFRAWAADLIERARSVDNLCTAHTDSLLAADNDGPSVAARIESALGKLEGKLRRHEKKHG